MIAAILRGQSGEIAYQGVVLVRNGPTGGARGAHIQTSNQSGKAQASAAPAAGTSIGKWLDNCAANALCWGILR